MNNVLKASVGAFQSLGRRGATSLEDKVVHDVVTWARPTIGKSLRCGFRCASFILRRRPIGRRLCALSYLPVASYDAHCASYTLLADVIVQLPIGGHWKGPLCHLIFLKSFLPRGLNLNQCNGINAEFKAAILFTSFDFFSFLPPGLTPVTVCAYDEFKSFDRKKLVKR